MEKGAFDSPLTTAAYFTCDLFCIYLNGLLSEKEMLHQLFSDLVDILKFGKV